jgi:hypothetical protein
VCPSPPLFDFLSFRFIQASSCVARPCASVPLHSISPSTFAFVPPTSSDLAIFCSDISDIFDIFDICSSYIDRSPWPCRDLRSPRTHLSCECGIVAVSLYLPAGPPFISGAHREGLFEVSVCSASLRPFLYRIRRTLRPATSQSFLVMPALVPTL